MGTRHKNVVSGFSRTRNVVSGFSRTRNVETADRAEAIRLGVLPEEQVAHWTEIEAGRYQPRRTRGSYRGRELA